MLTLERSEREGGKSLHMAYHYSGRTGGWLQMAGANEHVHWFHGGKGLGISQGINTWFSVSKSLQMEQLRLRDKWLKLESSREFKRITDHLRGIYRIYLK